MNLNSDYAKAYLAALVDGEGCVYVGRQPSVIVTVCDREILDFAAQCLDLLAIEYTLTPCSPPKNTKHRQAFTLSVHKSEAYVSFAKVIKLQHALKAFKLEKGIARAPDVSCRGCGCQRDQATAGCKVCYDRHMQRARFGEKKSAIAFKNAPSRRPHWRKKNDKNAAEQ